MDNFAFTLPPPGTAARARPRRRRNLWQSLRYAVEVGYMRLCQWMPVLLLLDVVANTSLVLSFFSTVLAPPTGHPQWKDRSAPSVRAAAIWLLALFLSVLFLLVASLVCMWVESWFIYHRGFRAPGANFGLKPIMQAARSQDLSFRNISDGNRPSTNRLCLHRASAHLDRMHPATAASGKKIGCLPLYDHWCFWLWVPVCMTTNKAYLLSMAYILMFHAVSVVVLAWSLSVWGFRSHGYSFAVACAMLPAVINFVFTAPLIGKWKHLAVMNSPGQEWDIFLNPHPGREPGFPMCVRSSDGSYHHRLFHKNPWDLGTMGNLRQVLGEQWWMWPWPFLLPKSVRDYGRDDNFDLPFSEDWLREAELLQATPADVELRELPPRQRHLGSSSG
ncbi:hypothetical protein CkaCkLH20_11343 [Colletotrichum karsti]|uniref:Palmitoyltransferase n=1 Tax=Colletotrichum karsti TaxID=1095194 RepID=A0A9P6HVF6_9PEZI|nr:uncharacterized protein CkaCkLH20_11343 [Colletotrichum karsti]KAF9871174.1 hypothetical protein CkaCkLH20_11343 [Colletotrichum karsti]